VSENQDKRSFIRYKNVGTSFFRFVTIHSFDRQTHRQTDGRTNRQAFAIPCVALHASHGKKSVITRDVFENSKLEASRTKTGQLKYSVYIQAEGGEGMAGTVMSQVRVAINN